MGLPAVSLEADTPRSKRPDPSIRHTLASTRSLRAFARPSFGRDRSDELSPTMKDPSAPPVLHSRRSNLSLFNLFRQPKVERARAHGGEGTPPSPPAQKPTGPLKSALKVNAHPIPPPKDLPPRSTSAFSFYQQTADSPSHQAGAQEPVRPQKDRKPPPWDPPPLFLAYHRSGKHGLAGVSGPASDKSSARSKTRKERGSRVSGLTPRASVDSNGSAETNRTSVTTKPAGHASTTLSDVPRKIVVLLDSGFLLHYTEHGPSDRLPEKALHLGRDSAAFASDAIAGKSFVIRVVQSVVHKTISLPSSASILSKFSKRMPGPKRETSMTLVLQSGDEMDSWLHAIRAQISTMSGQSSGPENTVQNQVHSEAVNDGSSRVDMTPVQDRPQRSSSLLPVSSSTTEESSAGPKPPPKNGESDVDDDERKGSLEKVEEEAAKLAPEIEVSPDNKADRRTSDAPSYSSSRAPSVDQQALSNLRSSVRMSHTSNVTGATSRTNSLSSESPSNKVSSESGGDNASVKSSYRNLSSYHSAKRRSAMPLPTTKETQPIIELSTPPSPSAATQSAGRESLTLGRDSPLPNPASTVDGRSPVARKPQSSAGLADEQGREAPPGSTPPIAEEGERPQSFVADLPPPSTWSSKLSPKKRAGLTPRTTVNDKQVQRVSSAPTLRTSPQPKTSKRGAQAFRLPLKINPDTPATRPPSRSKSRNSFSPEMEVGQPTVHTLEAKVDPSSRLSPHPSPQTNGDSPGRMQRLSLFPSPLLAQTVFQEDRKQSPSLPAQPSSNAEVDPVRIPLKRPTSVQVRTDPAPFLSSLRSNGPVPAPSDRSSSLSASTRAPPIRSLKPSRSSSAIPSGVQPLREQPRPASPTDPFTSPRLTLLPENERGPAAVRPSHMPKRTPSAASPPPTAPLPPVPVGPVGNSFAQQKALAGKHANIRSSTASPRPPSDYGVSVAGLGPPRPPPRGPLPAPPLEAAGGLASRSATPTQRHPNGSPSPSLPPPQMNGFGIKVGS